MQAVNYTYARNNLKSIIDDVNNTNEEYIITNKNNQNVVMVPLQKYNQIKKDIQQSFQEIKDNDLYDIDTAFDNILANYED
ncbi:MAG: type II toxin-antitoxin system Phd/YefM family antitoxin [Campylobacterota bacterium]|nr:type II toxin-antitoxin system Phd/YefM family antitoxin [Campylobacterota bacterium]